MNQQQETSPQASNITTEMEAKQSVSLPSSAEKHFQTNSFVIEDSFYRARLARPVHWSVAWSDLMMTMFVLFLSMFVYQASHEEFLVDNSPEIIGGSTTEALDILGDGDLIVPIVPLTRNKPLINSGTVKTIEKVQLNELDIDNVFSENTVYVEPAGKTDQEAVTGLPEEAPGTPELVIPQDIIEPAPITTTEQRSPKVDKDKTFNDMYTMSQQTLTNDGLSKFASIELVPDKTMRIILTGDLLFHTGRADLSPKARQSLTKIAAVIKTTPYMINVIGHTDNLPMHSSRFASNWELSVVRASSVARFLINEMGMNPAQFIVSGYGAQRPRRPNTNAGNRAANRRVEIIVSKRLAPVVQATPENLL